MLTTKRFDYVGIDQIHLHPSVANHRPLNETKVAHYAEDIARNGLLEPLVVWERNPGEFYLVGGFTATTPSGASARRAPATSTASTCAWCTATSTKSRR